MFQRALIGMSLFHLWSDYPLTDADDRRRHTLARSTWPPQRWTNAPVLDGALPRHFLEGARRLPFVRDLFDFGCSPLAPEDIVVFTNADIGMVELACVKITLALQYADAGWSLRRDFHHRLERLPTLDEVERAALYPGMDVFFFRVSWWREHRALFPDMLLAREAWDPCLQTLMVVTHGNQPLEVSNTCWHESHGGKDHWGNRENRYRLAGQLHNLALAKEFLRRLGRNAYEYGVR